MAKLLLIFFVIIYSFTANAKELRCGWLDNPSPANIWLIDKDSTWEISIQGKANKLSDKSMDLVFKAMENQEEFIRTNRNNGFSCACLTVDSDKKQNIIKKIYQVKQLLLKKCLEDISITKQIPLPFK